MITCKNILVAARDAGFFVADRLLALFLPRKHMPNESVLVVRFDEIGDFVLWLDSVRGLKELYKGRPLILAANSVWADLAESTGVFDRVLSVEVRRLRVDLIYRFKILVMVRRMGLPTVVHPAYSRQKHFIDAESLVRLSGATERIGSTGDEPCSWRGRWGTKTYTRLIPASSDPMMELIRNAQFIRGLGLTGFKARVPVLSGRTSLRGVWSSPDPYYVLFPGAHHALKRWPVRRFGEIAEKLYDKKGWLGLICGSGKEVELGATLQQTAHGRLLNMCGRTSLPELAHIFRSAEMILSNDTSAVHLGVGVGTKVVCVVGGGYCGRFLPYQVEEGLAANNLLYTVNYQMPCYNCKWRCTFPNAPFGTAPCIQNVSAKQVWEVIDRLTE